MLINY
jgi:hypothetical protein